MQQIEVFERQLQWSIDRNLPVVVHCREAFRETVDCIRRIGAERLRGVFHSFGGTREELEELLSLPGFMIGVNGVATFKKAKMEEVLPFCPLDRLVLETDAPYLAPVPYRGKRNETAYIALVANHIAGMLDMAPESVALTTSRNACRLFGLGFDPEAEALSTLPV